MKGMFLFVDTSNSRAEVVTVATCEGDCAVLKRALKDAAAQIGPGRSMPVVALEVTPEYEKYLRRGAEPIEQGQTFSNQFAASQALGISTNKVAHALSTARKHGATTAEVRGIVWQLLADYASD